MNRDKQLKYEIINWLFENEFAWQRINSCVDTFRNYIYDNTGNYLIGGKEVYNFIKKADALIYGNIGSEEE